jgi:hypothetical protein
VNSGLTRSLLEFLLCLLGKTRVRRFKSYSFVTRSLLVRGRSRGVMGINSVQGVLSRNHTNHRVYSFGTRSRERVCLLGWRVAESAYSFVTRSESRLCLLP